MNWSFRFASVAGIPIRVHITFLLILLLGGYQWGSLTRTLAGAAFGVALMSLLFACVTLHELGHSLVARAFGVPVREIVLLPLGGLARMGRNPETPTQDLLIALAGPAVNVLIAVVLLVPLGLAVVPSLLTNHGLLPSGLGNTPSLSTGLLWLLAANVSLVVFNLIPAYPLDGGRILRALLAMFLGYPRATRIAVGAGQLIAIAVGLYGVLNGQFLITLVAVFIFFGAGQETAEAEAKTVLDTLRAGDAYNKHALTLAVGDRVSRVVDYILTSYQPDFAVMQARNPIGIVTRNQVLTTLASAPGDIFVTEIMQRDFLKVDANKSLSEVRQTMGEKDARIAAVYDGAVYLGLIGREDIAEAFAIQTFVRRHERLKPAPAHL